MMFYALVWMMVTNGVASFHLEPMKSLEQCRAIAAIMEKYLDETVPDIRCAAIIFDKRIINE